jgi:hypothetical protein
MEIHEIIDTWKLNRNHLASKMDMPKGHNRPCVYITIGKEYEVILSTDNVYLILDDVGDRSTYSADLFKSLVEIRDEKLNLILEI